MFKETADKIEELRAFHGKLGKLLDVPKLVKEIERREGETANPAFWADSLKAKKASKELNDLKKKLGLWQKAEKSLDDLKAHLELVNEVEDQAELKEVQ